MQHAVQVEFSEIQFIIALFDFGDSGKDIHIIFLNTFLMGPKY
jgi:hypothetical protein